MLDDAHGEVGRELGKRRGVVARPVSGVRHPLQQGSFRPRRAVGGGVLVVVRSAARHDGIGAGAQSGGNHGIVGGDGSALDPWGPHGPAHAEQERRAVGRTLIGQNGVAPSRQVEIGIGCESVGRDRTVGQYGAGGDGARRRISHNAFVCAPIPIGPAVVGEIDDRTRIQIHQRHGVEALPRSVRIGIDRHDHQIARRQRRGALAHGVPERAVGRDVQPIAGGIGGGQPVGVELLGLNAGSRLDHRSDKVRTFGDRHVRRRARDAQRIRGPEHESEGARRAGRERQRRARETVAGRGGRALQRQRRRRRARRIAGHVEREQRADGGRLARNRRERRRGGQVQRRHGRHGGIGTRAGSVHRAGPEIVGRAHRQSGHALARAGHRPVGIARDEPGAASPAAAGHPHVVETEVAGALGIGEPQIRHGRAQRRGVSRSRGRQRRDVGDGAPTATGSRLQQQRRSRGGLALDPEAHVGWIGKSRGLDRSPRVRHFQRRGGRSVISRRGVGPIDKRERPARRRRGAVVEAFVQQHAGRPAFGETGAGGHVQPVAGRGAHRAPRRGEIRVVRRAGPDRSRRRGRSGDHGRGDGLRRDAHGIAGREGKRRRADVRLGRGIAQHARTCGEHVPP